MTSNPQNNVFGHVNHTLCTTKAMQGIKMHTSFLMEPGDCVTWSSFNPETAES